MEWIGRSGLKLIDRFPSPSKPILGEGEAEFKHRFNPLKWVEMPVQSSLEDFLN